MGAAIVLFMTRMVLPAREFISFGVGPVLLFALHAYYKRRNRSERLHLLTGSMAILLWSAATAAIVAHVGMRIRMPLVDPVLAAADRSIGVDTPALVLATAREPRFASFLGVIYMTAVPAVLFSVIALSLMGRARRTWELLFGYCSGLQIAALVSVFFPALDNFAYAHLTSSRTVGLPAGSGTFFLPSINYFRNGTNPVVDVGHFNGVVAFPSFHAIMALIVAYALRNSGLLTIAAYAWSVALLVSTIPIGGHYVVDVIGGAILWLAGITLTRRLRVTIASSVVHPGPSAANDTTTTAVQPNACLDL